MNQLLANLIFGMVAGFANSVPLGPGSIFGIQRNLSKGLWSGFYSGLGCAASDVIYATLTVFCLSIVQDFIDRNRVLIFLVGGAILIGVGLVIFQSNPVKQIRQRHNGRKKASGDFFTAFVIAITNPACIALMLGIFSFFGRDITGVDEGWIAVMPIILGVLIGATAWWFTLHYLIHKLRKYIRLKHIFLINRISGSLIALLGLVSLADGVIEFIRHLPLK